MRFSDDIGNGGTGNSAAMDDLKMKLAIGETVAVEFKRGGNGIMADSYETICAFLNRFGGDVYWGVLDDGSVEGLPQNAAPGMVRNLINNLGNINLFIPAVHLEPDPKNPIVAAFFRTIGFADELGSGVRKMFKYGKSFAGADPELVEGDMFRSVFDLKSELFSAGTNGDASREDLNGTINGGINGGIKKVIAENAGIDFARLAAVLGKSRRTVERAVAKLKQQGIIEYRGSKKTGGYYFAAHAELDL